MEFQIGDRVRYKYFKGVPGTVITISEMSETDKVYGVVFDNKVNGHDLIGLCKMGFVCKNGYGWWCCGYEIELCNEEINLTQEDFNSMFE